MRIRKGDSVVVITGDEKGDAPHRVIEVLDEGRKLIIEGINRVHKHVKRGHPKSPQGGRLTLEMPIDASNVMLFCPACGKKTRVGHGTASDGRKTRVCRKCSAAIGEPMGPAKAKSAAKAATKAKAAK